MPESNNLRLAKPYSDFLESLRNEVSTSTATAIITNDGTEWCGRYLKDFLLNITKSQSVDFRNALNALPNYSYSSFEQMAQKGIGKKSLISVLEVAAELFRESSIKGRLEAFIEYCEQNDKDISGLKGYAEIKNIITSRIQDQVAKEEGNCEISAQEKLNVEREITSILKAIRAFPYYKERLSAASPDEARRLLGRLNELRALYPNYLNLEIAYCRLLLAAGNIDAALDISETLYKKNPEQEALLNTYLLALMRNKRYEDCETALSKSLLDIDKSAMLLYTAGCLAAIAENYQKAIDSFLKCISLEPDYALAYYHLVRSYNMSEQYIEAENVVLRAIQKFGDSQLLTDELLSICANNKGKYAFLRAIRNKDKIFFSDVVDSMFFFLKLLYSHSQSRIKNVIEKRLMRLEADPLSNRMQFRNKCEGYIYTLSSLRGFPGPLSKSKFLRESLLNVIGDKLNYLASLKLDDDDDFILGERLKRIIELELLYLEAKEKMDFENISRYLVEQANVYREFDQLFFLDKSLHKKVSSFYKKSARNEAGGIAYLDGLIEFAKYEYSLGFRFHEVKHVKRAFSLFRRNFRETQIQGELAAGFYVSRIKMWECAVLIGKLTNKPKRCITAIEKLKTYLRENDYPYDDKELYWSYVRYFVAQSYLYLYQAQPLEIYIDEAVAIIHESMDPLAAMELQYIHGETTALHSELLLEKYNSDKNEETLNKALDCVDEALEIFSELAPDSESMELCSERRDKIISLLAA